MYGEEDCWACLGTGSRDVTIVGRDKEPARPFCAEVRYVPDEQRW